jgi:hypothetical protein
VGDGTTSVVILAAELLKRANDLVRAKIHPTSIISGYRLAMREVRGMVLQVGVAKLYAFIDLHSRGTVRISRRQNNRHSTASNGQGAAVVQHGQRSEARGQQWT